MHLPTAEHMAENCIFVVGNSRSGTTMMARILGNHPHVFTFQELHFFDELMPSAKVDDPLNKKLVVKLYATLMSIQRNGYFGSRNIVPLLKEAEKMPASSSYGELYRNFLYNETVGSGRRIPCEHTPQNIFALPELLSLFPDGKIILMVRDPRAVLLSQKFKWKRRGFSGGKIPFMESLRSRINYHPLLISRIWKAAMGEVEKYRNHPQMKVVLYEQLVANPEAVISDVCRFAGLDYSSSLLDVPVTGSSVGPDVAEKRGIHVTNTDHWREGGLSDTEIFLCQQQNRALMGVFGYDILPVRPSPFMLTKYALFLPFNALLAVLFNLKRLRDPVKVFRRFRLK